MRPMLQASLLALVVLLCSGYSGCEDKDGASHLLLNHGSLFRKDPISETTLFSRDYPGVPNPFADALDTRWRIYARRNVQLGNLWSHQLNFIKLQAYDDGSGFTPSLVAEQLYTLPSDGLLRISLHDFLMSKGVTSSTPDEYRIRVGAGGSLHLGDKKTLKTARTAFLKGMEPYPAGAGSLSALALAMTLVDGSGGILSQSWSDFPVFAEDAFTD